MEKFDINKELKNLEGLNVIAKCSALNDLCCTLRESISDINNAKKTMLGEYESSCRKKFIDEINTDIKANFDGKIPYVDNYGYKVSYDGIPTYINFLCIEGEWYIDFSVLEGSLKPVEELIKRMKGNSDFMEVHVSEEELVRKIRFAFFESDIFTNLVQENMAIDQEVIFKFGDLANTVSSKIWKTTSLEALEPKTDWVVILTDDAEAYRDKINTIVTKIQRPKTCFVIDLHPCANYKHLQELWDNYVMTDRESVEVLLSFINHHLVHHSMNSFTIQDFRERSVLYPLVRAISTEIGKKCPIDLKAKAMCFGLCFEHDSDQATSYLNTFNEELEEIDEDAYVSWSIQNSADNIIEAIFFYEPKF